MTVDDTYVSYKRAMARVIPGSSRRPIKDCMMSSDSADDLLDNMDDLGILTTVAPDGQVCVKLDLSALPT